MMLDGPGFRKTTFESLPATIKVTSPGDYTVTQTDMRGNPELEQFFVHVPQAESNITKTVDELPMLRYEKTTVDTNTDLLLWIASAALILMFVEWWLHSKESM